MPKILSKILISIIIIFWIFSGWPKIWNDPIFPPQVDKANAVWGVNQGTLQNKTLESSVSINPLATIAAGKILLVRVAADDPASPSTSEHSVSDSQGNIYTKIREQQNRAITSTAGDGVIASMFVAKLDRALTTSDTVTVSFALAVSGKAISLDEFYVASGNTVEIVNVTGANRLPDCNMNSVTLSGLTSQDYLFLGMIGVQGDTGDAFNEDADYASLARIGTTGGAATSNITNNTAVHIATLTGDTYDPTLPGTCRYSAWILAAIKEVSPTYEESGFRLFNNNNSTDVGTALAALNTAATLTSAGQNFRLRTLLHVGTARLALNDQSFKLQFVGKGAGTCASPSGGTPASYTDVSGSTAIAYNDNATPTDNVALIANANDPTHSTDSIVNQTYEEANNFSNLVAAIASGQDGGWDFSLKDNSAPGGTSYCLRVIKSDGTLLDTYTYYPQITTLASGTLTVDIVDDTGASVSSPSLQLSSLTSGFSCQTPTGTLGVSTQKIRVNNTTGTATWTVSIAAANGSTAPWLAGSFLYDFNDSGGSPAGCSDGADADTIAGQMTLDPSVSTITPQSGCATTGLTKGSSSAFSEGVTNSIALVSAGSSTQTNCYWDITAISISQTVPADQEAGSYTIDMTITVVAS